jgi:hypothetical protein
VDRISHAPLVLPCPLMPCVECKKNFGGATVPVAPGRKFLGAPPIHLNVKKNFGRSPKLGAPEGGWDYLKVRRTLGDLKGPLTGRRPVPPLKAFGL